jgi:hypothetical protein
MNGYADITHVAIIYDGTTYSLPAPNRHHNVIRLITATNGVGIKGPDRQGFLDSNGIFLSRRGAYIRSKKTNQLKRNVSPGMYDGDELFSEDLW